MDRILPTDPRASYLAHRDEIDAAIAQVLAGGRYILGDEVRRFEEAFAAHAGVAHCVTVANGTDALALALRGAGVEPGDVVITVSHTVTATVAAVQLAGGVPVLVDIDSETMTMSVPALEAALARVEASGRRVAAVMPVHLYGRPADLRPMLALAERHGFRLVEDCAQAHGAELDGRRVGGWGHVAGFSFYPTKNLGALGDGGAVVTDDPAIAERVRLLRQYGWRERYVSEVAGTNSRLDEIQAAILNVKLAHLDAENDRRRDLAAAYRAALADTPLRLPVEAPGTRHVYHQFAVRHADRDALRAHLAERGIDTLVHYPVPVHWQPAYTAVERDPDMTETERAAAEVLSLPLYAELDPGAVDRVAAAVREWAAAHAGRP